MRLRILGNPRNRRVTLFRAAAVAAGLPEPAVTGWREVAAGGALPADADAVRIDSPGEDAEVDRLLRGASEPAEHGGIVGRADWYAGFTTALRRVATGVPGLLNPVEDLAVMCDKRRCHATLAAAGVPVPPAATGVHGYRQVRELGWPRVFVKPAHGSCASGVVALAFGPGGRVVGYTSVRREGDRLLNTLGVHRYDREPDLAALVDALAPDGLHVERWLPKLTLAGRVVDLRVVVTAGRPTHLVVRSAAGPITNLHLGNARGDLAGVRAAVGEARWRAAMDSCVLAAGCFRGSLHVGVDLLVLAGRSGSGRTGRIGYAVAEVNAFGDLLPGLLTDGRDTYAEQIEALVSGRFETWRQGGHLRRAS